MSNKNLLLGLLLAWLAASGWWQKNKIENCETSNATETIVDSTASTVDSTMALPIEIPVDSAVLASPAAGTTEDDLANNEKYSSVFKPMNLYFHTNEAEYIKTDENQKFLSEAKTYLAENTDKSLSLTGHTDSDGAEAANQKLSERRANDVKSQFAKIGFAAEQLITDAKGEIEPAASNDTPEGKKANRRVTIVVNK